MESSARRGAVFSGEISRDAGPWMSRDGFVGINGDRITILTWPMANLLNFWGFHI